MKSELELSNDPGVDDICREPCGHEYHHGQDSQPTNQMAEELVRDAEDSAHLGHGYADCKVSERNTPPHHALLMSRLTAHRTYS